LSGLTGSRYLLAVAGLMALASIPMLVVVVAGAAVLSAPPAPVETRPFVSDPAPAGCPGWAGWPAWPERSGQPG
jgi:hypothetical protein